MFLTRFPCPYLGKDTEFWTFCKVPRISDKQFVFNFLLILLNNPSESSGSIIVFRSLWTVYTAVGFFLKRCFASLAFNSSSFSLFVNDFLNLQSFLNLQMLQFFITAEKLLITNLIRNIFTTYLTRMVKPSFLYLINNHSMSSLKYWKKIK